MALTQVDIYIGAIKNYLDNELDRDIGDFWLAKVMKVGMQLQKSNSEVWEDIEYLRDHEELLGMKSQKEGIETLIEEALGAGTAEDFDDEIVERGSRIRTWRWTRRTNMYGERAHVLAIKWFGGGNPNEVGEMQVAFATGGMTGQGSFPVYSYRNIRRSQFDYLLESSANAGRWLHRNYPKADEYIGQVTFGNIQKEAMMGEANA